MSSPAPAPKQSKDIEIHISLLGNEAAERNQGFIQKF